MVKIPKLKKKISSFLTKEDGKISKENLIKAGVLLSAVAIISLKGTEAAHSDSHYNAPDVNDVGTQYSPTQALGSHGQETGHNQHASHSSHGSHASHGSHGSHGQW